MTTLPIVLLLAFAATAATAPATASAQIATAPAPGPTAAPASEPTPAPPSPALLAEFKRIDTNEDGRVSSSEHEVYARKLFDQLDADVDYKLTVSEIMAAPDTFFRHVSAGVGGIFGGTALSSAERIQRIDANRDGVVSRDEHADAARAKYQAMDSNNNGELSEGEFVAGG